MPTRFRIVDQHDADPEFEDTVLPPGQRDPSGFWYPMGYRDPKSLVRRRGRRHAPPSMSRAARAAAKQI